VTDKAAKSDAGQERLIHLDPATVAELEAWRACQDAERDRAGEAYEDGGYVFTRSDGRLYHPDYLAKVHSRLAAGCCAHRIAGVGGVIECSGPIRGPRWVWHPGSPPELATILDTVQHH
jgi:hypothetical protein